MRIIKILLSLLAVALIGLALITYIALEAGGVTTVTTVNRADNSARQTHIWFVEWDGAIFLEAGHPQNPWVQDLQHASMLTLSGAGLDGKYEFTEHGPESHPTIRRKMRDKYGWRDAWINWLFDTSQSYMIQLRKFD